MSEDIDHVILKDCMQRLLTRDPDAGFDLAQLILGDLPNNDVSVLIAIIEGLIHQSEQLGSNHAKQYLEDMWPNMRSIMVRRLKRAGRPDKWNIENSNL
ncbi:hypothetical protein [Cellvibrio mixtus]|uniref:hypothetical protein n=1 Tax=Cellvibrio mixtus TaxID=39650 RepID=UPI000586A35F|nr:hypothetical protein [Cellvibrio mixtus]